MYVQIKFNYLKNEREEQVERSRKSMGVSLPWLLLYKSQSDLHYLFYTFLIETQNKVKLLCKFPNTTSHFLLDGQKRFGARKGEAL